jgi:tetratricopeptide (TPR) repeat protein
LAIRQKLADANPTVTGFRSDLARSHNSIGVLLIQTGKPSDALGAFESALAIQKQLADANPTVILFRFDLASGYNNLGNLLREIATPAESLAAFESALEIRQDLAREHPESPEFTSDLGLTLHNMALLHMDARRFEEARVRLRQAAEWQRKALAANSTNPDYWRFLAHHLSYLIGATRALGDDEGAAEAGRELVELRESDPASAALDARLAAIVNGDPQPADVPERLALAQRAFEKALFATAARLWGEALDANATLGDDRRTQHRYNAACSAALSASGRGRDDPPPDDAGKAKLRQQALGWLKAELDVWARLLAAADGQRREFIARTLEHWQQDSDLAGIRDPDALAKLKDGERKALSELWADAAALRGRAEAPGAE